MRSFVVLGCLGSLTLLPAAAFAEPAASVAQAAEPSSYVQAGVMVGAATPVAAPNLMASLETGWRLSQTPVWLRAAASYGASGDDQGPGSNLQLRAGIEHRNCGLNGAACGVVGIDAGYQRGRWSDRDDPTHNESSDALVVIPRLGVDLGGANLRARAGVEVDVALLAESQMHSSALNTSETAPGLVGLEANIGLAYQW